MRTAEIARKRFASALAAYPIWAKRRRVRTHWAARKSTKAKRPVATTARTSFPFHPVRGLASASTGPGACPRWRSAPRAATQGPGRGGQGPRHLFGARRRRGLGVRFRGDHRRRCGAHAEGLLKSMTTHADHRVWQDVYRPKTPAGEVYVKLTVIDDVLIVSFKEL